MLDEGSRLHRQGRYAEAERPYLAALRELEKSPGPSVGLARALNNLAALYYSRAQYEQAEPLFLRPLAVWKEAPGAWPPEAAATLGNLAALHSARGRFAEAEDRQEQGEEAKRKSVPARWHRIV